MSHSYPRTFADAATFLAGGRSKSDRPIENNTRLVEREDGIAIRLHETDVVTYHDDGSMTLNSGGWRTVTTKDRINKALGWDALVRVGSERGVWYVYSRNWEKRGPFFDGIRILNGEVVDKSPWAEAEAEIAADAKLRKQIKLYIDGFARALDKGIPMPSGGDCWYCAMHAVPGTVKRDNGVTSAMMSVSAEGPAWGDLGGDSHLVAHMEERYYVPSLLCNAYSERGFGNWRFVFAMDMDHEMLEADEGIRFRRQRRWDEATKQAVTIDKPDIPHNFRSIMRRYMMRRLLPNVESR